MLGANRHDERDPEMKSPESTSRAGYHHGDLKSALLEAARILLERDGPEAISFRAIARAAGVSQTAPYHHFQNKEDLLATLAGNGFQELGICQEYAAANANPGRGRIVAIGLDYVRFAIANPQLYRLMFGVGISNWRAYPDVLELKSATFRPIQTALTTHLAESGKTDGVRLEDIATSAWSLVHGMSMLIIDGSLDHAGSDPLKIERILTGYVDALYPGRDA